MNRPAKWTLLVAVGLLAGLAWVRPAGAVCADCCSTGTKLKTLNGLPSGSTVTGHVLDGTGANLLDLTAGGLYFGGAGNTVPIPSLVPNTLEDANGFGGTYTKVTGCAAGSFTLSPTGTADVSGSVHPERHCSSAGVANGYSGLPGCLFGPPLAIPNATSSATSTCVINRISTSAAGTGDCDGNATLSLPLLSDIYLTGPTSGLQPCPLCNPSGGCVPIVGKKILAKDVPKLLLLAKDLAITPVGISPNAGSGATLTITVNAGTVTFNMPAVINTTEGWTGDTVKGWKYKNSLAPAGGGVKVALIKFGKLKVLAKSLGDTGSFPLTVTTDVTATLAINPGTSYATLFKLSDPPAKNDGTQYLNKNLLLASGTCPSTCSGGPNNGQACVAESSVQPGQSPPANPTSHDCPPASGANIGALPIPFALSTGTQSKTSALLGGGAGGSFVFCGFCGQQFAPTFQGPPAVPCTADSQCTTGLFVRCRQRDDGAFDPAMGGTAKTITETGTSAGCLADGLAHPVNLVSIFCIPPSFNATVDGAADLPGPGAVSLPGSSQQQ